MSKAKVFIIVVSLVFCVPALAPQEARQRPASRERIRENLHRLRLLQMTEALELTEEQTAKIYPAAARIEKEKAALSGKIGQEIRELRGMLRAETLNEQALSEKVKSVKELRKAIQEKDQEFEDIIEGSLSEIQKARYLLFSLDFYRGMSENLERARQALRQKKNE